MLESLVNPKKVLEKPHQALFLGVLYAFFAGVFSMWVFSSSGSVVMVAFAALLAAPFMYVLVLMEEKMAEHNTNLLVEHKRLFTVLSLLTTGFILGFVGWFFFSGGSHQGYFVEQAVVVHGVTGNAVEPGFFLRILTNNLRVLAVTVLFSLLLGLGGIFIIVWNTSVIALAIGELIEAVALHSSFLSASLLAASVYLIHGVPELVAYFIAGVAGSMLSVALLKGHLSFFSYTRLWKEIGQLFLLSVFLLVGAALIEAYFTPLLLY